MRVETKGKKVTKETIKVDRDLIACLPLLIPLGQIRGKVVEVRIEETKEWRLVYTEEWAHGNLKYAVTLPEDVARRIMLYGPLSRKILLQLTGWAREKKSLELHFTKRELLKELGYTDKEVTRGGKILQAIDDVLVTLKYSNLEVKRGRGKIWKDFERWIASLVNTVEWKESKIYVELNRKCFGDPKSLRQYVNLSTDRLTESLSKDETFALDYVDSLHGFPVNTIGVRKFFTQRLGYTPERLKHMGRVEILRKIDRILKTLKERGRLVTPLYKIEKKTNEKNVLEWKVKLYLSVDKGAELKKEVLEWLRKSQVGPGEFDIFLRRRIDKAMKKWTVVGLRGILEWCKEERKGVKVFWNEVDRPIDPVESEAISR